MKVVHVRSVDGVWGFETRFGWARVPEGENEAIRLAVQYSREIGAESVVVEPAES